MNLQNLAIIRRGTQSWNMLYGRGLLRLLFFVENATFAI